MSARLAVHGEPREYSDGLRRLAAAQNITSCVMQNRNVTKERYIKAFDPAVLAAMKTLDDFRECSATVQQVN